MFLLKKNLKRLTSLTLITALSLLLTLTFTHYSKSLTSDTAASGSVFTTSCTSETTSACKTTSTSKTTSTCKTTSTSKSTSSSISTPTAISAVSQLQIIGSDLCDSNGNPIQLKGMSSHGLQWYGNYMNYDSLKYLKDSWGINVIRAALYTDEGGYISNPTSTKAKLKEIVDAAIDLDLYVIIDWHILHDYDPNTYKTQSKSFFEEMATEYGKYPNIIYEICNEPNGGVSWNDSIKPYAEYIIPAIRAIDPDNIIIVGTSTWSQDVDIAANNPLSYSNIMYAFHFYAGTHGQSLRDKIDIALSKGAAIFVSEWGTTDCSGNGNPYLDESQVWIDYMNKNNLSWCNWSLCDKNEGSAALKPGASTTGGWSDSDLTTSSLFVKKNLGGSNNPNPSPTQVSMPKFSLSEGTYSSTQTVKLSSATNNATIHYTIDGSTPTISSPIYSEPLTISKTTTIKALAVKSSMTNSNIASATYTIIKDDHSKPEPSDKVEIKYDIVSDWGCGSTINVTITNNGSTAIDGWTLVWNQPSNITITNMWNGSYTKNSTNLVVTNLDYNKTISPNGGSQNFGFNISYTGQNSKPTVITINGIDYSVK